MNVTGTAYIHGIQHATGNYVFIMDADLSHHVSQSVQLYMEYFGCYQSSFLYTMNMQDIT